MKIKAGNKELTGTELFHLVFRGWFAGVTAIFVPFLFLGLLVSVLPDNDESAVGMMLGVFMVPFIAAMQGLMIGALVLFGLKIWPPKN